MEESGTGEADDDIQTQQILLAASQHDLPQLGTLLRNGSASVQDPETGITPLHAAIAACEPSSPPAINGGLANGVGTNGNHSDEPDEFPPPSQDEVVNEAAQTVKFLLEQGAIWNDVDKNNETPGCLALKLGVNSLYDLMVDAGVRAEMLLNRLDEYEQLADDVSIGGEQDDGEDVATTAEPAQTSTATEATGELGMSNDDFLRASLYFQNDRILDESQNGVMMAWETDIMKRTVDLLIPTEVFASLILATAWELSTRSSSEKRPVLIISSRRILRSYCECGVRAGITNLTSRSMRVNGKILLRRLWKMCKCSTLYTLIRLPRITRHYANFSTTLYSVCLKMVGNGAFSMDWERIARYVMTSIEKWLRWTCLKPALTPNGKQLRSQTWREMMNGGD